MYLTFFSTSFQEVGLKFLDDVTISFNINLTQLKVTLA